MLLTELLVQFNMEMIEAKGILRELIDNNDISGIRNEAQTRFHIIDIILKKCFDWEGQIEVEQYIPNNGFSDFELGNPKKAVVEAKREGTYFDIPAKIKTNLKISIKTLYEIPEIKDAMEQVQSYCSVRGIPIGIITNGHQIIAFLASRTDGIPYINGDAIVFTSLNDLYLKFTDAWNYLSNAGMNENRLIRHLTTGDIYLPPKLSTQLIDYPKIRYHSHLQITLKELSQIFIQDILDNEYVEAEFYKRCYCESGALSKYALLSKFILDARYASIFLETEQQPTVLPVTSKAGQENSFTPEVLVEAISKRPIILIGDVGVGKTSFIKNLKHNSAYEEFKSAIYIYIDLGTNVTLNTDLENFILHQIESQLSNKYDINIFDRDLIMEMYEKDIERFNQGLYGTYKTSDPDKYQTYLIEYLDKLVQKEVEHKKNIIDFLAKTQNKQTIICIDNADQRDFDIQEKAFLISQELAKEWKVTVFLSLRPQTFYKSKRYGAFSAYPHKIFTISPPRVDLVIEKRLRFAADVARGEKYESFHLHSESLATFLDVLIYSLHRNKELNEFLVNITGGNIRAVIEFVTSFIGSPNVEAEKIINLVEEGYEYQIPIHEFTKQALLGDYSHFNSETSISMNVLDISYPDPKEHFLVPIIISYLSQTNVQYLDKNGFCSTVDLISECQNYGFSYTQVENALRRATNKKLIETSLRITFEENSNDRKLVGNMPSSFRVTTIGAYHIKKWLGSFSYLDAMLYDTPIMDKTINDLLINNISSLNIKHRYERTLLFKEYLLSVWTSMTSLPTYFDFSLALSEGEGSFSSVIKAIEKLEEYRK